MSIGAKDYIDKLLVEKYSKEQVENHDSDALISKVNPDDMLQAMNTASKNYRNILTVNNRLTMVCYGVIAKSAKYIQSEEAA